MSPDPTVSPTGGSSRFFASLSDRSVGLCVLGACLLLYLPFCGSYGFWDPWESHYAEVARQMRARGDWISLWWPGSPQDRNEFWSKPVFTFWVEAVMFWLFRLGGPGSAPGEMALRSSTEWACRIPMVLFGVMGVWSLYYAASRLWNRRAGVLAALVCATSPLYFLIARQAITDMPFVAPMTAALCLGAVALLGEDKELPRQKIGPITIPASPFFYWVAVPFLLLSVPQLIYNSVTLRLILAARPRLIVLPGIVAMLPYIVLFGWFLFRLVRSRRQSQLQLQLAYLCCGISGLSKGLVGVALPGVVLLLFLVLSRDFKPLRRLDILSGLLCIIVIAFPWYHAMLIRHGMPFWSELFGDNHWRRLAIGRHGDRGSFEYYLRELGYGLLPWSALAPVAACVGFARAGTDSTRSKFLLYASLWALAGFSLVTFSMTKFHHYILPAIPALALLCGWFLDALLAGELASPAIAVALWCLGLPLMGLVVGDLSQTPQSAQRLLWLFDYDYINSPHGRAWPEWLDYSRWLIAAGFAAALATGLCAIRSFGKAATLALAVCAVLFTFFGLDKFLMELSPHWSQKHLLATYYRMKAPGDRLVAWQMYWRGETFYSANEIYDPKLAQADKTVFLGEKNTENLQTWLRGHSGKRVFFVVERARLRTLQSLLPTSARESFKEVDQSNNKFVLAVVQL